MKELSDILCREAQLRVAGLDAALATVVRVHGSSYRRPGARMLISGDGQITGGVSGGCLERDVVLRAGGVVESRQPLLVRYDTTLDVGGDGGGYSLGCGGTIDVLIEPLRTPAGGTLIDWLQASQNLRHALVTVVSKHHAVVRLGTRMAVLESGQIDGQILDADVTKLIGTEGKLALLANHSRWVQVQSAGNLELFVEILNPPLKLLIFGAGNDVVPLAGLARALGWRVTVVDVRSSPAGLERNWEVDQHIRCPIGQVMDGVSVDASSAAVVMTHHFANDQRLIEWLMPKRLRYLGLLGPRHRTDQLLVDLPAGDLHSPVGLDLGADNPEEVALAIVSEITAVLHSRTGVSLSAQAGPIHAAENHIQRGPDRSVNEVFSSEKESEKCPVAGS